MEPIEIEIPCVEIDKTLHKTLIKPEPECEPFTERQLKVIEEMIDKRIREVNLNVDVGRGDPYGWHDIKIEVSLRFDYDDTITSANDGFSFPNTNREW